jgi:CheY-like chemotaxis protein
LSPKKELVFDLTAGRQRLFVGARLKEDGYAVAEAEDGAEALESFRREPAQVVITDVGMPRLGGRNRPAKPILS